MLKTCNWFLPSLICIDWPVSHACKRKHWLLIDWLIALGFGTVLAPMLQGLIDRPFVPHVKSWEPCYFTEVPDGPKFMLSISSGSKKKEPRCTCLSEAKASHSQRMWAEVSSFTSKHWLSWKSHLRQSLSLRQETWAREHPQSLQLNIIESEQ
jgi:hypothetical protein